MLRWRRPLREAPARTCAEKVGSGGGAGARTEGGKESVRPQYDASGEALGGWAAKETNNMKSQNHATANAQEIDSSNW